MPAPSSLHILHLTHQYPPEDMGGVEVYTRDMARQQVRQGHRVTVVVPSQTSQPLGLSGVDENGVRVVRIPTGSRGRAKVFAATWHSPLFVNAFAQRLQGVDLVHVQHLMGIPLAIFDLLQARRIPYVITLHDYWFPCANAQLVTNYDGTLCNGPDPTAHNCARCFVARGGAGDRPTLARAVAPLMRNRIQRLQPIFAGASAVVAVSEFVRKTYAQLGFGGDHVQSLTTGIEIPILPKRSPRDENRPFHALYLGSIAPPKGVHVLVEAFNQMPRDARLTIAGGLEKFPDYVAQLRALATHPNIRFVGQVLREDVGRLLVSAEVAILPTLWYEASPLTISEFFAAGLPIIASDIGAVADRIRHNIDGLLFPPNDVSALQSHLQSLYDNPQRLSDLRSNLPPVATMATYADQIEAIYRQRCDALRLN